MDVLPLEPIGAALGPVIHQEVSVVQVFVVAEDQALVRRFAEPPLYPDPLVGPRTRIVPGSSRENVRVEDLCKFVERVHGTRHRPHQAEDARRFVKVVLMLCAYRRIERIDSTLKVDEHSIHVDVENLLGAFHAFIL